MLTAGIVAEYNPFHNGHKYLIEETRRRGATHIIAVMSGAAVQRGSVAVFDKYSRASAAVKNGADLVLELPCPYSCSNGEVFARSAVEILASLGVVDRISFGCETDNAELLRQAAEVSEDLKNSAEVKALLSGGASYPKAVCAAAEKIYGREVADVLASPNGVLAAEYCKAASKLAPDMEISPVLRKIAGHHETAVSGGFTSASKLREMLKSGEDMSSLVPCSVDELSRAFEENMQNEILFILFCADRDKLLEVPDVSPQLADRILRVAAQCPKTLDDFYAACKNKSITMARLRRTVLHFVLGVTKDDIRPVPYARILSFNKRGAQLLSKAQPTIPVDTSLRRLEQTSDHAARVSRLERNTAALQYFCSDKREPFVSEYSRKITITDE